MQSGIQASSELISTFNNFTSDPTLFALPITIASESLQALEPIHFTSSDFTKSLPSLSPHLQPKTPIYLVIRKSSSTTRSGSELVAITYVPSIAPVRAKTLFASTRASLVRDLGLEKFADTLFVTDAEEVLDPKQWEQNAGSAEGGVDTALLTREERELQGIKRAEEEERHGTSGRDLMGAGGTTQGSVGGPGVTKSSVQMKATDEVTAAFQELRQGSAGTEGGSFVQIGIDIATETLTLLSSAFAGVDASQVSRKIPADRPSYTFFHYPGTSSVIFIYTCPGTSKVKERMMYAASRRGILNLAESEGIQVAKRLEAGEPGDITEQRLREEVGASANRDESPAAPSARQGFAKPKRPGRK